MLRVDKKILIELYKEDSNLPIEIKPIKPIKPIENDLKPISKLRKSKKHVKRKVKEIQSSFYYENGINKFSGYQEIFFLKFITECDPHFRELYDRR